jgi:predicted Zn-ribbon and HTH transcriptional regulator
MAALLKYEMRCTSEDCGKPAIILVESDEIKAPNLCPFCGAESVEATDAE